MIKLIVFSMLGKKLPFAGSLFSIIKTYLILYLVILPVFLAAQEFEWAKSRPLDYALNPDMTNFQVCIGDAGNIYWMGISDYDHNYNGSVYGSLFFETYNDDGTLLSVSVAEGIAAINNARFIDGNLYIILGLRGLIEFSDGSTIPYTGADEAYYLVKLSVDMTPEWNINLTEEGYPYCKALSGDINGNIVVGKDSYLNDKISRYDANGNLLSEIEQISTGLISSIDTDLENNTYVAGSCAGSGATFAGVNVDPDFGYNTYIVKYNALYEFEWVRFVEDVTCPFTTVVCNDPEAVYFAGDLYISNSFGNIQSQGPQWVFDFFVTRLNSEGEFMWVFEVPEQLSLTGDAGIGRQNAINVDDENNVYLGGFIRGEIDWGNGLTTSSTNIGSDVLALKISHYGNLEYAFSGGGELYDKATTTATDNNGNLYISGFGQEYIHFGNHSVSEEGTFPFLAKINNGEVTTALNVKIDEKTFSISPNPAKEYLSINLSTLEEIPSDVIISNQFGSIVYTAKFINNYQIPIGRLIEGIYFLRLRFMDGSILTGKFVKK